MPSDIKIDSITFYQKDGQDKVTFVFNDENLLYSVILNSTVSEKIKNGADEVLNINEIKCYLSEMNDVGVSQIYFEYNGNVYEIIYNNKQDLVEVVENLKETE